MDRSRIWQQELLNTARDAAYSSTFYAIFPSLFSTPPLSTLLFPRLTTILCVPLSRSAPEFVLDTRRAANVVVAEKGPLRDCFHGYFTVQHFPFTYRRKPKEVHGLGRIEILVYLPIRFVFRAIFRSTFFNSIERNITPRYILRAEIHRDLIALPVIVVF